MRQMVQVQKMATASHMTVTLAHDLNNVVMAIASFSRVLTRDSKTSDDGVECALEISRAADKASEMLRQILAFSRDQVTSDSLLDLNEVARSTERMIRNVVTESISISSGLSDDPLLLKGDREQLEQVAMNLAINARDAMPSGGRLTISTSVVDPSDPALRARGISADQDWYSISISDTGEGMTTEVKSQAFDPFFSTKNPSEGTGLGLSNCLSVVRKHGGHIGLDTERRKGSTFTVYLPRAGRSEVRNPDRYDEAPMPKGSENVLVVEDEPTIRSIVAQVLDQLGYKVLQAANGHEALWVASDHAKDPIDLLLTDVVMPSMGGAELAQRMRETHPELRALFMSGYGPLLTREDLEPDAHFMEKPFTPVDLAHRVRETLDSGNQPLAHDRA